MRSQPPPRVVPAALHAVWLAALLASAPPALAQAPAATRTRTHVETLASDRFDGRLTGTDGERLAREYIAGELRRIGATPLPGRADFFLPFEFTAGTRDGGSAISLTTNAPSAPQPVAQGRRDIQALSFSDSGEVTGSVVFAGYGIVVPDAQNFGYDSYATLDVKDKIVLVLRY